MEMEKTYNPKSFEKRIYDMWEENGCFKADNKSSKEPFTVVMPPPNITGQLHIGHALDNSMQDSIVRYKRMKGYETLWLPGTDHASIATEVKIIEKLKQEGIKKQDLGREGFLKRAFEWKEQYGGRIIEQIRSMGASCDWDRLAFTMDENLSKAVKAAFVTLYNKGLIYQGDRIINWCPSCKTALSDAEVEYSDQEGSMWHIQYPLKDGSGSITVATTRPETMLGDTAVAVNPKDERYTNMIGKTLILPLVNKEIPIISDEYVEMDFGTGCVKITPAHDPNDFEVGLRHNLEVVRVLNDDGTMNENAGKYQGLDRYEARKQIVKDLQELGLLLKIEKYSHNVGECYRCHTTIEPIVSKQWFVKMGPLAEPAIKAVKEGKTQFIPDRFSKTYFNWMENIRDWCISRQLWWGHRIPAYYCEECGNMMVSEDEVTKCTKCGSTKIHQDEDVLDTWFSSALWPFSTLGWPNQTEDLRKFYPTSVLITGYDIIFFWVARMIFSGIEYMKDIPFKEVLIHGLVRDSQGKKMSKSSNNGVDPLEVIENYGADTLRFSLLNGISQGGDVKYSTEKVEGARNFINKIWNASRFVLMNCEGIDVLPIDKCELTVADKWILTRLNRVIKLVTNNMDKYELGNATATLHDFVWSEFCDWYIELTKPVLYSDDEKQKQSTLSVLVYVLENILKLMHPYIPFITEEIYQYLPNKDGILMVKAYPTFNKKHVFDEDERYMKAIMDIIGAVRNLRAEMNVNSKVQTELLIKSEIAEFFMKYSMYLTKLAFASDVRIINEKPQGAFIALVQSDSEVYIPMGELIDKEKELARLNEELKVIESEIKRAEGKLNNQGFVAKAPKALIDSEKEKIESYTEKLNKTKAQIEEIKKI